MLHPRSRVRFAHNKLHTSIQGSRNIEAFPAQGSHDQRRFAKLVSDFVEGSNFERPLPTLSTNQGGLVESSSSLPDSVIGKDGMRLARDFENRANMRLSKLIFGQKVVIPIQCLLLLI